MSERVTKAFFFDANTRKNRPFFSNSRKNGFKIHDIRANNKHGDPVLRISLIIFFKKNDCCKRTRYTVTYVYLTSMHSKTKKTVQINLECPFPTNRGRIVTSVIGKRQNKCKGPPFLERLCFVS